MKRIVEIAVALAVLAIPAQGRADDAPLFPPPPDAPSKPVLGSGGGSHYYRRGPLHHGFDLILTGGFGGRFGDDERDGPKFVLGLRAQEAVPFRRGVRGDLPGLFGTVGLRTLGVSSAFAEAGGGLALLSFDHYEDRVKGFSVGYLGAVATAGVDSGESGLGGRLLLGVRTPVVIELGGGLVAAGGSTVTELFISIGGAPISRAF